MIKGRPLKFNTVEEIQNKIDEYFNSCYRILLTKDGKAVRDPSGKNEYLMEQYRPFTICGLAQALEITRETLLQYGKKKEFSDTVMRAKQKCEVYAEERLFDKDGCNGAKFSLTNNFKDWKDKQEAELVQKEPFKVKITVVK